MTADNRLAELIRCLGCPVAVCSDRELQTAELRQRHQFVVDTDWWDGYAEIATAPDVPMVVLRYSKGVNVATFNEGSHKRSLNVWARFPTALFPLDEPKPDMSEDEEVRIEGETYRAYWAVMDISGVFRPGWDRIAAYGTHILDRTVVAFGPPEELHNIRLEWLSSEAK